MKPAELDRGFGGFPLIAADDRAGRDIGFFNDWVSHPGRDAYWRAIDGNRRWATTKAPILLMPAGSILSYRPSSRISPGSVSRPNPTRRRRRA